MYAPAPEPDDSTRANVFDRTIPVPPASPLHIGEIRAARPARRWLKVPAEKPFFTPLLLGMMVAIFTVMSVAGGSLDATESPTLLITWGAKVNRLVYQGEWWRLITSTFLHGGLLHLFLNGSALYFIGMDLEGFLGKRRFFAIYSISALGGSVASFISSPFNIPGVGASGAIFGLIGALAVYFGLNRTLFGRIGVMQFRMIVVVIGLNLLFGLGVGFSGIAMIDNWAHLGGLFAGVAVGLVLSPRYSLSNWTMPNVRELLRERSGSLPWVATALVALNIFFIFIVSLLLIRTGIVLPR
jgi:rhomboid protease GluP